MVHVKPRSESAPSFFSFRSASATARSNEVVDHRPAGAAGCFLPLLSCSASSRPLLNHLRHDGVPRALGQTRRDPQEVHAQALEFRRVIASLSPGSALSSSYLGNHGRWGGRDARGHRSVGAADEVAGAALERRRRALRIDRSRRVQRIRLVWSGLEFPRGGRRGRRDRSSAVAPPRRRGATARAGRPRWSDPRGELGRGSRALDQGEVPRRRAGGHEVEGLQRADLGRVGDLRGRVRTWSGGRRRGSRRGGRGAQPATPVRTARRTRRRRWERRAPAPARARSSSSSTSSDCSFGLVGVVLGHRRLLVVLVLFVVRGVGHLRWERRGRGDWSARDRRLAHGATALGRGRCVTVLPSR